MQYALLIARDETAEGHGPAGDQALAALFERLGSRLKAGIRLQPTAGRHVGAPAQR